MFTAAGQALASIPSSSPSPPVISPSPGSSPGSSRGGRRRALSACPAQPCESEELPLVSVLAPAPRGSSVADANATAGEDVAVAPLNAATESEEGAPFATLVQQEGQEEGRGGRWQGDARQGAVPQNYVSYEGPRVRAAQLSELEQSAARLLVGVSDLEFDAERGGMHVRQGALQARLGPTLLPHTSEADTGADGNGPGAGGARGLLGQGGTRRALLYASLALYTSSTTLTAMQCSGNGTALIVS